MMKIPKILIIISFIVLFSLSFQVKNVNAQLLNTVVALTGNIFDAVSKEPVTVFIVVLNQANEKVGATRSNAFENGYYYITGLKPGNKYTIIIRKPKYFREKYEIHIANSDKYEEISRDFLVKPLFKGSKIPFQVPPFELNKSKLRFGSDLILSDLKNTLVNNPKVNIEIQSYPDNNSNTSENKSVTMERCKSLMNYFVSGGVDPSRLRIKGFDKTDPKNPPPTRKRAKGKRYIGSTYLMVTEIN